ncbi:MAG: 50S ribosomal protein L3, partial [Candidatus Hodarchaeales archaeon]
MELLKHAPHRGSLGYRRKRARRHTSRLRTWPDSVEPRLLGYAGYKAGMTHISLVNTDRRSPFYKQEQFIPVTILETPPLFIFALRVYEIEPISETLQVSTQIWSKDIEKDLGKRIQIPKEKMNQNQQISDIRRKMDKIKEIRVLVHTNPNETGFAQKNPDILEIKVGGP